MGNTEVTQRGGSCCCAAGRHPGGPAGARLSTGHPLHSALSFFCLISFFSTGEMLYLPPPPGLSSYAWGRLGGLEPRCLQDAPSCWTPAAGTVPCPHPWGFPGSLPTGSISRAASCRHQHRGERGLRGRVGKNGTARAGGAAALRGGVKGEMRPGAQGCVGREENCVGVLAQQLLALWGRGVGLPTAPRLLRTHPGAAVTPCPGSAGS